MTAKTSKKKVVKKTSSKKTAEAAKKNSHAVSASHMAKKRSSAAIHPSEKQSTKHVPIKKPAIKKSGLTKSFQNAKTTLKNKQKIAVVKKTTAKKDAKGTGILNKPHNKLLKKPQNNAKKTGSSDSKSKNNVKKISNKAVKPVSKSVPSKKAPKKNDAKNVVKKAVPVKTQATSKKASSPKTETKTLSKSNSSKQTSVSAESPRKKAKTKMVRPSESIYFSMDDLNAFFERRENGTQQQQSDIQENQSKNKTESKKVEQKVSAVVKVQKSNKPVEAASMFDILGISIPTQEAKLPSYEKIEEQDVPRKWKKYYKLLIDLRKEYSQGVSERAEEVHKRSVKEDSGDLSSYGQHLADAGSESFERDMSYNILEKNKFVLNEINEAVKRIKNGTYGVCEITGTPIPDGRLTSIPYTRFTKEGQEIKEEEERRKKANQRSVFDIPTDNNSGEDPV